MAGRRGSVRGLAAVRAGMLPQTLGLRGRGWGGLSSYTARSWW